MSNHIDLEIANEPDPGGGWRMVERGVDGPQRFKNPRAQKKDTIRWHAPNDHDMCIVILDESPFARKGDRIVHQIIDVPKSSKSEKFDIAPDVVEGTYEYAVLLKEREGEYTYVRGENSPPGVVVGGP